MTPQVAMRNAKKSLDKDICLGICYELLLQVQVAFVEEEEEANLSYSTREY